MVSLVYRANPKSISNKKTFLYYISRGKPYFLPYTLLGFSWNAATVLGLS